MSSRLESAVLLLRKLLETSNDSVTAQVSAAFGVFTLDELKLLIREYPDVLISCFRRISLRQEHALENALLTALQSVPAEELTNYAVVSEITSRAAQNQIALAIVNRIGLPKVVQQSLTALADPNFTKTGAKALGVISELDLPETDRIFQEAIPELARLLRLRPGSNFNTDVYAVVSQTYYVSLKMLSRLISRKVRVTHLETLLAEYAQTLAVKFGLIIFSYHEEIRNPFFLLVQQIIDRVTELRSSSVSAVPIPGAKDIAKALFQCQWQDCENFVVTRATELIGKLDVNDVVDAALEVFPLNGSELKALQHDNVSTRSHLALRAAASLAAGPAEGPVHLSAKKILRRLENFLPSLPKDAADPKESPSPTESPRWSNDIYSTLGVAILPELWRLGFVDRRLANFYALEMIGEVVNQCSEHTFPLYHQDILKALKSDQYKVRFDAHRLLRALPLSLFAGLSPHLLAMVEDKELSPASQVEALSLLSAQHWRFGLDLPCADARLDMALRYCSDSRPDYRHAAIRVLMKALKSMHHTDWQGFGPHIAHPRGAEIASKVAAGIADPDKKFAEQIEGDFRESTNELRVYCVLGLLEAAVQNPTNPLMLRAVHWTADLGCGYWGPVHSVNTERADIVCRALESTSKELRQSAAKLFFRIVSSAEASPGDRLIAWLAQAVTRDDVTDEVIDSALYLADNLPARAALHSSLVTNVIAAPERLLKPTEQVNLLRKLAGNDTLLLGSLIERTASVRGSSSLELLTKLNLFNDNASAALSDALARVLA